MKQLHNAIIRQSVRLACERLYSTVQEEETRDLYSQELQISSSHLNYETTDNGRQFEAWGHAQLYSS
jgi:hypothetical protein